VQQAEPPPVALSTPAQHMQQQQQQQEADVMPDSADAAVIVDNAAPSADGSSCVDGPLVPSIPSPRPPFPAAPSSSKEAYQQDDPAAASVPVHVPRIVTDQPLAASPPPDSGYLADTEQGHLLGTSYEGPNTPYSSGLPGGGSPLALGLAAFQLSLCGDQLRPGVAAAEAQQLFDTNRVTAQVWAERGAALMEEGRLVVKVGANLYSWQVSSLVCSWAGGNISRQRCACPTSPAASPGALMTVQAEWNDSWGGAVWGLNRWARTSPQASRVLHVVVVGGRSAPGGGGGGCSVM
jgi:hypothetical protein